MAYQHSTRRHPRFKDLTGKTFGLWRVLEFHSRDKHGHTCWLCRCQCGTEKSIQGAKLTGSGSKSCHQCASTRHGHGGHGSKRSPEYRSWSNMLTRCQNHSRYSGRGIVVCKRWKNFDNFLADVGLKPSPKHTIERIDNDGNYESGNCRWATRGEQARNRCNNQMLTLDGKTMCMVDWAEKLGISKSGLRYRLTHGWSVERALTTPVQVKKH